MHRLSFVTASHGCEFSVPVNMFMPKSNVNDKFKFFLFLLHKHDQSCNCEHVFVSKLPHHREGLHSCCTPTQMISH